MLTNYNNTRIEKKNLEKGHVFYYIQLRSNLVRFWQERSAVRASPQPISLSRLFFFVFPISFYSWQTMRTIDGCDLLVQNTSDFHFSKCHCYTKCDWITMQLGLQCYYTFYCSVEQCGMCRIIILKRRLSIIRSLWLFWHATFYSSSWFSVISGAHKRRFTVASSSSQFIDTSVIQRL